MALPEVAAAGTPVAQSAALPRLVPPTAKPLARSSGAAVSGGKVDRIGELEDLRTETTSSYLMSDASVQVELSMAPVHYLDADGEWEPIDPTVSESRGGFTNETNTVESTFGGPDEQLVSVVGDAGSVELRPLAGGPLPAPTSRGSRVRFQNVFADADVRYEVIPGGVKEDIVLPAAPPGRAIFDFELVLEGLTARGLDDGSIGLFDDDGDRPAYVMPAPFMYDSSAGEPARSDEVSQSLTNVDGRTVLRVEADRSWLNAPVREYPVVVDPSIVVVPDQLAKDAAIFEGTPNTSYPSGGQVNVGKDSANNSWRGLLQFDTSVIPVGTVVRSADLNLHFNDVFAGDGNAVPISVHQVADLPVPWEEATATWNSMNAQYLAAQGSNQVTVDDADGDATSSSGPWKSVDDVNAVGGSHSVLTLGTGPDTFDWLGRVPGAGDYKVDVRYLPGANRGTPTYVLSNKTTSSATIAVNQTTGTSTGEWRNLVMSYPFKPAELARVRLTRQATSTTTNPAADAVRFTEFSKQTKAVNQRDAWHSFAVGSIVQNWVDAPSSNDGFMIKGEDETNAAAVGGPQYQVNEDVFGGETANRPQLVITYAQPGVTLNAPTVIHASGPELTWSAYVDPTTADGDDLVEYQIFRKSGTTQYFNPSDAGTTLVGTVASDTTSFTDTSATASSATTPAVYSYWVVARTVEDTRNGQNGRAASNVQQVTTPREGRIVRVLTGDISDTTVSSTSPRANLDAATNFSGRAWLQAGNANATYGNERALLKFDTSAIKPKVKVTEARLELFESSGGGTGSATFDLHALTAPFVENVVTWNTAPTYDPSAMASLTTSNAPKRLTFASSVVTSKVQSWVDASGNNFGFLLKARSETAVQQFLNLVSGESTDSLFRPRLYVEHLVKNDSQTIEAFEVPQRFVPGTITTTPVTVTNTSTSTWPSTLQLSYKWTLPDTAQDITVSGDRNYVDLGRALQPGESVALDLPIRTPINSDTGSKRLAYDLYLDLWNPAPASTWWFGSNSFTNPVPEPQCTMEPTGLLCQDRYVEDPTSNQLGLEKFASYTGEDTGGGGQFLTNLYQGNAVWSYDAFSNPSLGPSAFLRLAINSQDTTDTGAGYGVSVQPATMTRLGDTLSVPSGGSTSNLMTFVDGDGTTHTYKLKAEQGTVTTYDRPAGVALDLQRDTSLPVGRKWVFTRPDGTRFFFDEATGRQSAVVDRNGNTLLFNYTSGKLTSVTDASQRAVLTFGYDAAGLVYIRDISGRALKFSYNASHQLTRLQDGGGYDPATGTFAAGQPVKVFDFTYTASSPNSNSKLSTVEDPLNNISRVFYYDANEGSEPAGWPKQFVDRRLKVTNYSYTGSNGSTDKTRTALVTDVNGANPASTTTYTMDGYGRATEIKDAEQYGTSLSTKLGWDADHNVIRLQEANGAVSTWKYNNQSGYPTEVKDAEAIKNGTAGTIYGWVQLTGSAGQPWVLDNKTTPEGRTNRFTYDTKGNPLTAQSFVTGGVGWRTDYTYTYNTNGTLATAKDGRANVVSYLNYDANGYPRTIRDPLLVDTFFEYDNRGQVISVTDAQVPPAITTAHYDAFGRPDSITTPGAGSGSRTTQTAYDLNDNVRSELAPNGATTLFDYDAADNLMFKTLPANALGGPARQYSYTYDDLGRLATETSPLGTLTAANANDHVTEYSYDKIGQPTQVRQPFVNAAGNADAAITQYQYDTVGNQTKVLDPNRVASPATDFTTLTVYDLNHRPVAITDGAGYTVRNQYDRDGLLVGEIDALGNRKRTVYDDYGRPIEVHVPHTPTGGTTEDWVTKTEYDLAGNVTKVTRPDGVVDTTTTYDKNNLSELMTNADGNTVKRVYDAVGRLKQESLPYASTGTPSQWTTYTYWPSGDVKTSTDPWNIVTSYDYDQIGNQASRTLQATGDPATRVQGWAYWPDGSLKSKSDTAAQQPVDVLDNADGWAAKDSPPANWATVAGGTNTVGANYRTHAAATSGTANDTFTWTFNPDVGGNFEVWATCPVNTKATTAATYTINSAGGSTNKTINQKACTASTPWVNLGSYVFNGGNDKDVVLKPAASGLVLADAVKLVSTDPPPNRSFGYKYDANGMQTEVNDLTPGARVDTYRLAYDGLNRTSTVTELLGTQTKRQTGYTYDRNDNMLTSTSTRGRVAGENELAARYMEYAWDVRNQVSTVKAGDTAAGPFDVFSYTYDPRGMISTFTKPNNNVTTYRYTENGLSRSSVENTDNGVLVASHRMTWAKSGDIKTDVSRIDVARAVGYLDQTATYDYTPGRKLKSIKKTGADAASDETFEYDRAGNITKQITGNPASLLCGNDTQVTCMTYDRNRLLDTTTGSRVQKHRYDAFGRATSIDVAGKVVERYAYDGYDRLIRDQKWQDDGTFAASTSTTYDPFDRTVTQTSKVKTNNPVNTRFVYLGLADQVAVEEQQNNNDVYEVSKRYAFGPGGQKLSLRDTPVNTTDDDTFYYGTNPRGDVETLTGPGGATTSTYGYTAYGSATKKGTTGDDAIADIPLEDADVVNPYRFSGHRFNGTTGTYDMGFRDYSPDLNRYLTRDMYNGAFADMALGSDPWNTNRYALSGGNPASIIDLDGHWGFDSITSTISGAVDTVADVASVAVEPLAEAASAVGDFVVEHKATIGGIAAGIAIGVGCAAAGVATAGVAAVACLAAAGAVGSVTTTALDEDADHSLGGFVKSAVGGAAVGVVTFGGGKLLAPVVSKLAAPIKAGIGKVGSSVSGRVSTFGRTAITKVRGSVLPGSQGAGTKYLYRGVHYDHPAYDDALRGTARPWGGHSDPALHNGGQNRSEFTSWTTDEAIAREVASEGNGPGVVLRIANEDGPGYVRVPSPDVYGESEVLIQGTVSGADVVV